MSKIQKEEAKKDDKRKYAGQVPKHVQATIFEI
jgi:hypothetical protein